MAELPRQSNADAEAEAWANEWAKLLGLSAAVITSADAVMEAMRGKLGPEVRTTAQAAPIVRERVEAWTAARRALIEYAREAERELEGVANG